MRIRCACLLGAALWLVADGAPARADEVYLTGGSVLSGEARREGERVVVALPGGTVTLAAADVERIEASETPLHVVAHRYAALGVRDVAGRMRLADYCRDNGLRARELELLREVIALSPDHEAARARLGYVRGEAGWITREEHLRAQGLVQHEGRWITRAELLELERLRAQTVRARAEQRKAEIELETRELELMSQRARTHAERKPESDTDLARRESETPQQPQPASQSPAVIYHYGWYDWPAAERDCSAERPCPRPRARRKPAFMIPHVKDPFDYL